LDPPVFAAAHKNPILWLPSPIVLEIKVVVIPDVGKLIVIYF
jgi:hypothetical protein